MTPSTLLHLLTLLSLVGGLFFMFIGALGLWRFPDLYNRMHANTKCLTLGLSGLLLAVALQHGADDWTVIVRVVLVVAFQFIAAPVAAHMLGRAAHRDRLLASPATLGDELARDGAQAKE